MSIAEHFATVGAAEAGPSLSVRGLNVSFRKGHSTAHIVTDVSFDLARGRTLAIVGESGSGKTMTSLALMGLVQARQGGVVEGSVKVEGEEVVGADRRRLRQIRANKISMVFQDPAASLDPCFTIGYQIVETILAHKKMSRREAEALAVRLLRRVGIPSPERRAKDYPHELSGGMRQRCMIALALCCTPQVLIADEATTALDVTVQAQVLELLKSLQAEFGMSIVFITHDLGVVADIADDVAVMYAGEIIEYGNVYDLFERPAHPYLEALIASTPHALAERGWDLPARASAEVRRGGAGCRYAERCRHAQAICGEETVPLVPVRGRMVRCLQAGSLDLKGTGLAAPQEANP